MEDSILTRSPAQSPIGARGDVTGKNFFPSASNAYPI